MLNRVASSKVPLVLSPNQYLRLPSAGRPIVPIDVSWHMPAAKRDPRADFEAKRLPRARFLDLDEVATRDKEANPLGLPHMMPSAGVFASACQKLGITRSSHVVFYDSVGVFSSPRALFMFKAFGHENASILDGGLPAWISQGYPIEEGRASSETIPTNYPESEVRLDENVIKSYEQMTANASESPLTDGSRDIVLDARSAARYDGTAPEPRAGMSSGHMPFSYSLPFNKLLAEQTSSAGTTYTTLRTPDELRNIVKESLAPSGANLDELLSTRSFVNTCGSGMTAAIIWLALQQIGVGSALYDESWMGYASRAESKIVKTES